MKEKISPRSTTNRSQVAIRAISSSTRTAQSLTNNYKSLSNPWCCIPSNFHHLQEKVTVTIKRFCRVLESSWQTFYFTSDVPFKVVCFCDESDFNLCIFIDILYLLYRKDKEIECTFIKQTISKTFDRYQEDIAMKSCIHS